MAQEEEEDQRIQGEENRKRICEILVETEEK
jgi:hypothetical protein